MAAHAAPIRSDKDWAIRRQTTPTDWQALIDSKNVAAGRLVQARPTPNDRHTSSKLEQLTDGVVSDRQPSMHTDKRAVGWGYQQHVRLVIDLGEPQPVGRVLMRLQVLSKANQFPRRVALGLSLDGDYYYPARSLIKKIHPDDNPAHTFDPLPHDRAAIYALGLRAGYRARYVRLDFTTHGYLISDEIAVLSSAEPVEEMPPARPHDREYYDNVFDRRDQYQKMIAPGNLILGKALRYSPTPTQYLNIDDDDPRQLTDGKLGVRVDERVWFERGCVGWQGPPLMNIFADLGEAKPIGSVVIRLLGGNEQGSLNFPDEIKVLLSNDGKTYYQAASRHKRGLDDLSENAYDLPEEKLAWVHNFQLHVRRRARYVAVQILHQKQFAVSDEMAIVRGADDLPDLEPDPTKEVVIVTSGVAFPPVWGKVSVCQNMPLRARLAFQDARPGAGRKKPCKLVLDIPETLRFVTEGYESTEVEHDGRTFSRYVINWRGLGTDFYLQSLLPAGETDVLYTYGDNGKGLENERRITWESIFIPRSRVPKRLHVSLSWADAPGLSKKWPDYFNAQHHLGFNAVGTFPLWWRESVVPGHQTILAEARRRGFKTIIIESPASAVSRDRRQKEIKSQLPGGKLGHTCPSYRGKYYRKEHDSFARHAVWVKPDLIFYDIEAYWHGSQEAPRCSRCQERYNAGKYESWDAFRAAIGREIHVDIKNATEKALRAAGVTRKIIYGSYRTQPSWALNDGLFAFRNLYPDLLQMAMPSLYVVGNGMAVAKSVSENRALMQTNDIIPWLSTGCYGEYNPLHTRDMILEAFANGARGVTYYWYGHFDAAHFKYHAEAIDIVAPIEDLFMDGEPLTGLTASSARVKVCGMGVDNEMAVLVSHYGRPTPGERVTITTPARARTPVWDPHRGKRTGETDEKGAFTVEQDSVRTHLYYLGSKHAAAVARRP